MGAVVIWTCVVIRDLSGLMHPVCRVPGYQIGFRRQVRGHQARLGSDIQPCKHERTKDKSPPGRHKCLIFSWFCQSTFALSCTLTSLARVDKTGYYLDHSPEGVDGHLFAYLVIT